MNQDKKYKQLWKKEGDKMENYNKENKLRSKTKMKTTEVDIDCLPPFLKEYLNSVTCFCVVFLKHLVEVGLLFFEVI